MYIEMFRIQTVKNKSAISLVFKQNTNSNSKCLFDKVQKHCQKYSNTTGPGDPYRSTLRPLISFFEPIHYYITLCTCCMATVLKIYIDISVAFCSLHRGEAMYIFFISYDIAQKEMVLNSPVIHHLIMITCISYGNTLAILVPKCINTTPL